MSKKVRLTREKRIPFRRIPQERNPAHYCFGCSEYIGHRGWCSTKCHNDFYDSQSNGKESNELNEGNKV